MIRLTALFPAETPRHAFTEIVRNEARLARRTPVTLIVGMGLPVGLLVLFGVVPKFQQHQKVLGGLTAFDVYVPILLVFVIAGMALFGLPAALASYREQRILRRLSTTPVPPSWLLAAQMAVNLAFAVVGVVVVLSVAIGALGAPAPRSLGGLVLALLLAVFALFSIGLMIAAVARTATGAGAAAGATFFPLMFFAGLWVPRDAMPAPLRHVSNYTPLGAAVEAIQHATWSGFPAAAPLLVMVGYAVVFAYGAGRYFRWE